MFFSHFITPFYPFSYVLTNRFFVVQIVQNGGINLFKGERCINVSDFFGSSSAKQLFIKNGFDANPRTFEPDIVMSQKVEIVF